MQYPGSAVSGKTTRSAPRSRAARARAMIRAALCSRAPGTGLNWTRAYFQSVQDIVHLPSACL